MLAVEAEGHRIETIEGMARGHDLHPLQRKFLEHAALQCGFCTPSLLVAAKALLDRNPNPMETEVRYWLAGNLCRCTGYDKVIRAVLDAAAELRASNAPMMRRCISGALKATETALGETLRAFSPGAPHAQNGRSARLVRAMKPATAPSALKVQAVLGEC
jgi:xanthine dehydrogenase iron-sulfur cluster and FAD-binding subunit A